MTIMWCALGLLVVLSALCRGLAGDVTLKTFNSISDYHPNIVILSCSGGTGIVSWFCRLENSMYKEACVDIDEMNGGVRDVSFVLNHTNEGVYYCQVGGVESNGLLFVGEFKNLVCVFVVQHVTYCRTFKQVALFFVYH